MKVPIFILFIGLLSQPCFAQEPSIYGEWKVVCSAFDSILSVMEKDTRPIKNYDTTYFSDGTIESITGVDDGRGMMEMYRSISKTSLILNPDGSYKTISPDKETCEGRYRVDPVAHTITFLFAGASESPASYTLDGNQLYFPVSEGNCFWIRYERVSGR